MVFEQNFCQTKETTHFFLSNAKKIKKKPLFYRPKDGILCCAKMVVRHPISEKQHQVSQSAGTSKKP